MKWMSDLWRKICGAASGSDEFAASMALIESEKVARDQEAYRVIERIRERRERLEIFKAIAPVRMGHQDPNSIAHEAEWLWECFETNERTKNGQA